MDDFIRFKLTWSSVYFWHSSHTERAKHKKTRGNVEMTRPLSQLFLNINKKFLWIIQGAFPQNQVKSGIVQTSYVMSPGHPHDKIFLQTKSWHHGPTGVTGNSSWIWCSFLYVTLKTFHVIHFFHCGCLTICHPGMWTDAHESISSCCHRIPPHPSIVDPPTASNPQGGPAADLSSDPYNSSLEWAKRTSHCHCAGPLPALLHASLLMSALLLHTFPNSPQF